jgi:tight adherence protein C
MIDRPTVLLGLVAALGATLALSELRWFRRPALVERLRPYAPASTPRRRRPGLSVGSFVDVVGPLARSVGDALSTSLRIDDDAATRLLRIHSPLDATGFRIRQLAATVLTLLAAAAVIVAVTPPAPLALMLLLGAPTLALLAYEQHLTTASNRWRRRVFLELPVVAEQLGMLLSAGFSLGAALDRLARRGHGAGSRDLARVCARVQYGATEVQALREWADLVRVDGVDRLVSVLALNHEAGDLGRLIAEEARALRRDAHRELVESIERRAQLVWIPVTVAALLPGTFFLAIPFLEAMRLFTNP